MTDIPWIVSLDDHVVEPPDVWTKRLPAKYRDVGPHIVMAPPGTPVLDGGTYREAPGTEGDPVAWWFYEDQQYSVKRLIAAAGYPADEIGFDGDHVRPDAPGVLAAAGPPRRHDHEPRRGVALRSRTTRGSAGRSSSRRRTRSSPGCASRRTTTGRSTSGARAATAA